MYLYVFTMIIGITGTLGAGKGTIVEFLKKKGFNHFSASGFITEEIEKRGLPVNRDSMILVGNDLRAKYSPSYVAEQIFIRAQEKGGDCVLESLRTQGEIECLKEKDEFILFAIDADPKIRYKRVLNRKSSKDSVTFDEFIKAENKEMTSEDPTKQNLAKCISMADYVFTNNGSFEELKDEVEKVWEGIQKN